MAAKKIITPFNLSNDFIIDVLNKKIKVNFPSSVSIWYLDSPYSSVMDSTVSDNTISTDYDIPPIHFYSKELNDKVSFDVWNRMHKPGNGEPRLNYVFSIAANNPKRQTSATVSDEASITYAIYKNGSLFKRTVYPLYKALYMGESGYVANTGLSTRFMTSHMRHTPVLGTPGSLSGTSRNIVNSGHEHYLERATQTREGVVKLAQDIPETGYNISVETASAASAAYLRRNAFIIRHILKTAEIAGASPYLFNRYPGIYSQQTGTLAGADSSTTVPFSDPYALKDKSAMIALFSNGSKYNEMGWPEQGERIIRSFAIAYGATIGPYIRPYIYNYTTGVGSGTVQNDKWYKIALGDILAGTCMSVTTNSVTKDKTISLNIDAARNWLEGRIQIDLSTSQYSPDVWYPVRISRWRQSPIRYSLQLDFSDSKAPWSTHNTKGVSMHLDMKVLPSSWGVNIPFYEIESYEYYWCSPYSPVLRVGQHYQSSSTIVHLRGGAKYYLYTHRDDQQDLNPSINIDTSKTVLHGTTNFVEPIPLSKYNMIDEPVIGRMNTQFSYDIGDIATKVGSNNVFVIPDNFYGLKYRIFNPTKIITPRLGNPAGQGTTATTCYSFLSEEYSNTFPRPVADRENTNISFTDICVAHYKRIGQSDDYPMGLVGGEVVFGFRERGTAPGKAGTPLAGKEDILKYATIGMNHKYGVAEVKADKVVGTHSVKRLTVDVDKDGSAKIVPLPKTDNAGRVPTFAVARKVVPVNSSGAALSWSMHELFPTLMCRIGGPAKYSDGNYKLALDTNSWETYLRWLISIPSAAIILKVSIDVYYMEEGTKF